MAFLPFSDQVSPSPEPSIAPMAADGTAARVAFETNPAPPTGAGISLFMGLIVAPAILERAYVVG